MKNDKLYQSFLPEFEKEFEQIINNLINEFENSTIGAHYHDFFLPFLDLVKSGKRLRPFLIVLAKGSMDRQALSSGVALELLHTAALVHDDIIDNSDLRRSVDSAHKAYTKMGYPEDTAILLGDYLITYANQLIFTTCPQLVIDFIKMQKQLYLGQFFEMANWGKNINSSISESIAVEKSVNYTFKYPLSFGLKLCQKDVHQLNNYAHNVGLAFQMKDDWLDEMGTSEKSSNDKKNSVPNIVQHLLNKNKGNISKTKTEITYRLNEYFEKGLKSIDKLELSDIQKTSFKNLAVFCSAI